VGLGTTGSFDVLGIFDQCGVRRGRCVQPGYYLRSGLELFRLSRTAKPCRLVLWRAPWAIPAMTINANDTYIFTLEAFNKAGALLGTNTINVVAGHGRCHPGAAHLCRCLAPALLELAIARRRRKAKQA